MESEHRFRWFLSKTFSKLPNDAWFKKIDPLLYLYMFYSWQQDQVEKHKFTEMYSTFIGSFFNPQAASKLFGNDKNTFKTTNFEDTEKAIQDNLESKERENKKSKKKMKHRK